MLIVLAVFLILAIIFFMSSNYAMVKTKYSRALTEEKELISALQLYQNENMDVPTQAQGWPLLKSAGKFMTTIPVDPFNQVGSGTHEYVYISDLSAAHRCLVVSVGPDGRSDLQDALDAYRTSNGGMSLSGTDFLRPTLMSPAQANDFISRYTYDPTNGTTSSGDVVRVIQ
jgi:type II secretory pathway pseudopilin PulG